MREVIQRSVLASLSLNH